MVWSPYYLLLCYGCFVEPIIATWIISTPHIARKGKERNGKKRKEKEMKRNGRKAKERIGGERDRDRYAMDHWVWYSASYGSGRNIPNRMLLYPTR